MKKHFTFLASLFALIVIFTSTRVSLVAQATLTLDNTILTEREVAVGLQVPWEIIWGPDDHIWATEKRGTVLRISPENGNINTILDLQNTVESGAEPGLLGMAIHPDFEEQPYVYLVYVYVEGLDMLERLVRYTWNGSTLDHPSILLDSIAAASIHNGSRLVISPDLKILMTTGDVSSGNLSQELNSLNGKVLRINLDGSIPQDNPRADSYVYSYGHRNAQGLAYGPNGYLYSSEHGAQASDEFNLIEADRNYGWPEVQGRCNTNYELNFCNTYNVKEPLIEWSPCVAVNGITYYDHPAIPEWEGKMLMAVLGGFVQDPRLSVLTFNEEGTQVMEEKRYFEQYGRLRDVCVNPHNGAIFLATNGQRYPSTGPNRIIEYRNLDYITSTENPDSPNQFVHIYPNPAQVNKEITLEFSNNFIGKSIEIFQYDGQLVATPIIDKKTITIKLPKAGKYFIKAVNAKGMLTQSFVVQ